MSDPEARPDTVDVRDGPDELDRLADRLDPVRNRAEVVDRLERLFRSGAVPDPWPAGPQRGRLLATTTWAPWDWFVLATTRAWMPWLGKAFDPDTRTGVNRFRPTAAAGLWLRMLFPGHPQRRLADRIEAFPFRNAVGPGAVDADVRVLKIAYDFAANPWLIRRILDELVQVAPGQYLGKVLLDVGGRYRRVAFFSLSG